MNRIIFEKIRQHYFPTCATTIPLTILGNYLTSDVVESKKWIEWTKNHLQSYTSSNLTFISIEDDEIYLASLLDMHQDEPPCFVTSKEKFIKMLEDWDRLFKQQPDLIILTIDDNGNIMLEGKNNETTT